MSFLVTVLCTDCDKRHPVTGSDGVVKLFEDRIGAYRECADDPRYRKQWTKAIIEPVSPVKRKANRVMGVKR